MNTPISTPQKKSLFWRSCLVGLLIISTLSCALLSPSATPSPVVTASPIPPNTQPPLSPTQEGPQTTELPSSPVATVPPDIKSPVFANYPAVMVSLPQTSLPSYSLPVDLGTVTGMDLVELSNQQEKMLSENGFVVAAPIPGKYNEFFQLYESLRYNDQPVFATTDAVMHIYHLIFDKMLRDLEIEYFIPTLETLTQLMVETTLDQYQTLKGTPLEEPARRNLATMVVATRLLELPGPYPPEVNDLVEQELKLINDHSEMVISPIWDRPDLPGDKKLIEDYTQYIPRGHYTRSEALKRYFKAMMWFGRMTYRLRDPFETQRALLLTQALRTATTEDGTPASQLWQSIYDPTVFIVGKADDLSFYEYGELSDEVFGANPDLTTFADEALLNQFLELAKQLPPPQINSMWVWIWEDRDEATQGFRFMGQRFTLDAYVFGQLIWRKVGTLEDPRWLPKGLDFFAAQGSEEALQLLDEMGETAYLNYPQQMDKVRTEVSALELDSWTQNLYWSWLYTLQPIFAPKADPYPSFMQTEAWVRKSLSTVLGSWTELKHDTILYAKQVMAEMGGGEPQEPPHGYVEPDPEAYARMIALSEMTISGLQQRNLLSEKTQANLTNLLDLLEFMKSVSEKELNGEPLTEEEYWRIQYFGGELEALTIAASDCGEAQDMGCRDIYDQKSALIADVATGAGSALEEATGQPTEIYVVLPDQPWRIGIGGVFTYYEFPVSADKRMTDEEWQKLVEEGTNPPLPDWTSLYLAP